MFSHPANSPQQPKNNTVYQPVSRLDRAYPAISNAYLVKLPLYVAPGQIEYRFFWITPQPMILAQPQPIPLPFSQPTYRFKPILPMQPNVMRTEAYKERQKEKRKKQRARKSARKFFEKQQAFRCQEFLQETLTEKILRSDVYRNHIKFASNSHGASFVNQNGATSHIKSSSENYSQRTVLTKINVFLRNNHCDETTHNGHCHGLTLLWLTMMSWNVESLFYKMVNQIAECPYNKLHLIHKTIVNFLEWIDLGQNPGQYSGNKYSQHNIDKIIGNIKAMHSYHRRCSLDEASYIIGRCANQQTIVALGGKDIDRDGNRKSLGHTIGLFYRPAEGYSIYDTNYHNGKPKVFSSARDAANEVNLRLFPNTIASGLKKLPWDVWVAFRPEIRESNHSQRKKSR